MIGDLGDSKVTIKKDNLLKIMKENRHKHEMLFLEAEKGYRQASIEKFKLMLKDAEAGRKIESSTKLEAPFNHLKDYDRVIKMLELSVHDEICISETQFSQYVLDEWTWSNRFISNTTSYMSNR